MLNYDNDNKCQEQYKSRFSLIAEQILAFPWSTNLVREVKNLSFSKFQTNCITMSYVIDNSYSDK